MTFVKGGCYEHSKFMDVFVEVIEVLSQTPDLATLRVQYGNKGWVGEPFLIGVDIAEITIRDKSLWKVAKLARTVEDGID